MWVDGEEVRPSSINAAQYKRGTNVTLVPAAGPTHTLSAHKSSNVLRDALEEPLFEHSHGGDNTGLATS